MFSFDFIVLLSDLYVYQDRRTFRLPFFLKKKPLIKETLEKVITDRKTCKTSKTVRFFIFGDKHCIG